MLTSLVATNGAPARISVKTRPSAGKSCVAPARGDIAQTSFAVAATAATDAEIEVELRKLRAMLA